MSDLAAAIAAIIAATEVIHGNDAIRILLILAIVAELAIIIYQNREIRRLQQDVRSWLIILMEKMLSPNYREEVRNLHEDLRRRLGGDDT